MYVLHNKYKYMNLILLRNQKQLIFLTVCFFHCFTHNYFYSLMVNVLSLILMDNDNVSYIKTVCVKVHSHTVITHVLKVFIICSNFPLIQYMVILTLCKSLYVCVHNPFCERISLQENMKDFVFLTLYLKKERKKKGKKKKICYDEVWSVPSWY